MLLAQLLSEPWQWTVASGLAFVAVWLGYHRLAALIRGVGAAPPAAPTTEADKVAEPAPQSNAVRVDTLGAAIELFAEAGDATTAEAIANASPKVLFPVEARKV